MQEKLTKDEWDYLADLQEKYDWIIYSYDLESGNPILFDALTFEDGSGDNLLQIVSRLGDIRAVELLLKAGADVHHKGDMGYTPLHDAYTCKDPEKRAQIVALLLEYGASPDVLNEFRKKPGE
jgi:ankyrin repeat protein